ncbi:hypothetical protein F5Y17DRAFT_449027 [Xylariaceae sp. FL0594]|nr:hypothetical protein F5Y17DRAFT_449027 [Xylariaceae sp. FL0594]
MDGLKPMAAMSRLSFVQGLLREKIPPIRPWPPCVISRRISFGRPEPDSISSRSLVSKLPSTAARTRFAPSPTGYVHIGSLRTALYNYLLAKATGGQFLLRVEDTDQKRLVPDAEQRLYEDLKWAGLDWDEGPDIGGPYGPYKQSDRLQTYNEHANQLLKDGRAYRCFCTPEELDSIKKLALEESRDPVYNKTCSHIPAEESAQRAADGEAHCIRFSVKSEEPQPSVDDLVYGKYRSPNPLDDFILIKRDGFPTYHFANVIDDHLMKITHVIRGAEWLISTPRHAALYDAFGWERPAFAHVGLLVDEKKQKLSKRFGGFDLASWKEKGILPVALLNYVLLLGWAPLRDGKDNSEVMDVDEMIQKFHLRFTKGNVTVNNKSGFLQKAHLRRQMGAADGESGSGTNVGLSPSLARSITELIKQYEQGKQGGHVPFQSGIAQIGQLLSTVQPQLDDPEKFTQYLETLSQLDANPTGSPEDFVKRHVYLLWTIPSQAHQAALEEKKAQMTSLRDKETGSARKISDLAAQLYEHLEGVPEEEWEEKKIKQVLKPLVSSIQTTAGGEKPTAWGWQFLRWVISAGIAGPAVVPSMVVLQKKQTLARVSEVRELAARLEL